MKKLLFIATIVLFGFSIQAQTNQQAVLDSIEIEREIFRTGTFSEQLDYVENFINKVIKSQVEIVKPLEPRMESVIFSVLESNFQQIKSQILSGDMETIEWVKKTGFFALRHNTYAAISSMKSFDDMVGLEHRFELSQSFADYGNLMEQVFQNLFKD